MEKFYGNYRAVVKSNNDPKNQGRIKAMVYSVFDGITTDRLPWAQYADPFMGGGSDSGGQFVPDVGDHVWVFFEAGDPNQPIYFQGAPSAVDFPNEKIKNGKNRVFKTKTGLMVEFNDEEHSIKLTHENMGQIVLDDAGVGVQKPDGEIEPMVLGDQLAELLRQLIFWMDTHMHTGNFGLPTTPPMEPFSTSNPDLITQIMPNGDLYARSSDLMLPEIDLELEEEDDE